MDNHAPELDIENTSPSDDEVPLGVTLDSGNNKTLEFAVVVDEDSDIANRKSTQLEVIKLAVLIKDVGLGCVVNIATVYWQEHVYCPGSHTGPSLPSAFLLCSPMSITFKGCIVL